MKELSMITKRSPLVVSLCCLLLFGLTEIAVAQSGSDFTYPKKPLYVQVSPGTTLPSGLPLCKNASLGNIVCYSPAFVRTAYNFPNNLDGTGQTIVIVDAFGSPTIEADLALFDAVFGLPAPPSFTILCDPAGCPATPNTANKKHGIAGWQIETSLDVEYAHAMAPGANIVLVVASTSSGNAINSAETRAIGLYPGSIMSQSFGIPEIFIHANTGQVLQAHRNYEQAAAEGITVLASAGDSGATFGTNVAMANFPASDPLVTGVGGTQGLPYIATGTLVPCPAGQVCNEGLATVFGPCVLGRTVPPNCTPMGYGGEQVWNESQFGAATGGAPSLLFGVPGYQNGLGLASRGTPDVSYNAAIDGGVLVVNSSLVGVPALFIVGGTSAGSPQWASIFALVNQCRANHGLGPRGFANPTIYSLSGTGFHDITVGNNQLVGTPIGFSAGAGWDDATGWGTPNVANLLAGLAGTASCP
jgi:subtilase family serine protease